MATIDRGGVAEAFMLAHALAARPEVARHWNDESACDDLTVGGLVVHLLSQTSHTVRALIAPPPLDPPIGLLDHYDRAAWVSDDHDGKANVEIREQADARAEPGQIAVLAASARALAKVAEVLDRPRDPDTVHIPWQGWNLSTQDFLITRSMEVVVHSDDLAASVGLEPMEFPAVVTTRVVDLLSMLAVHRHGATAVVRSLARPQRAPESISAF